MTAADFVSAAKDSQRIRAAREVSTRHFDEKAALCTQIEIADRFHAEAKQMLAWVFDPEATVADVVAAVNEFCPKLNHMFAGEGGHSTPSEIARDFLLHGAFGVGVKHLRAL